MHYIGHRLVLNLVATIGQRIDYDGTIVEYDRINVIVLRSQRTKLSQIKRWRIVTGLTDHRGSRLTGI